MKAWFNAREPRERVLLLILAGLIVVFAAWFALSRERGPSGTTALEAAQTDREFWLRAAPKLNAGTVTGVRDEFTRGALIYAVEVDSALITAAPAGGINAQLTLTPL